MTNVISKEKAFEVLKGLDFHEIITNVTKQNPESPFHTMDCYLDLTDGLILYRVMGNNESFRDNHFICLFSQPGNFRHEFSEEDIAGDDEIPGGGIEQFKDYDERVLDAALYYQLEMGDEMARPIADLEDFYFKLEYYAQ